MAAFHDVEKEVSEYLDKIDSRNPLEIEKLKIHLRQAVISEEVKGLRESVTRHKEEHNQRFDEISRKIDSGFEKLNKILEGDLVNDKKGLATIVKENQRAVQNIVRTLWLMVGVIVTAVTKFIVDGIGK